MENSQSASSWQALIRQSFLSLYEVSDQNATSRDYFQGYDFVFEFSEAVLYVLVNEVTAEVSQYDIDASQIRVWRKDVVNQLMKRHAQVYLSNESLMDRQSTLNADKAVYFIGLTSLTIKHLNNQGNTQSNSSLHDVQYEYGSPFFAEDCVLDLDDEERILQIFSQHNFSKILKQLKTPADVTAFLQFHRSHLTALKSFTDESTLLEDFLQSADFYQKALQVQQQLVENNLLDQIEPRLLEIMHASTSASIEGVSADILKKSDMWYKLFNSLVQDYYEAGSPLPKEQVELLVDESIYTYASLVERILDYKYKDGQARWNGYIDHQPSYNRSGCHYMLVFYAQYESSPLSADKVRANYRDLLSELNAHLQEPIMEDLFLIGVENRDSKESVNTEIMIDIFYQSGAIINAEMQRLYEQLAELKLQS
ncbi:hypothetical protein ACS8E3_02445 [Psychrobacter sp. 2Y5]|uniref:hypothetical protein n=1 Tax=unclassified Psychrobacter TaxID=196806 RepID=UPI003F461334